MSSFMQFVVVCVTVAVGTVVSQNFPPPRGTFQPSRGGTFNCPNQDRGSYEYPGDCTKFYQCDGGVSSLIVCPPQLVFNSRTGYCDYETEATNANCAGRESQLPPDVRNICNDNPGIRDQAFHVGHPELCNAFYTCTLRYLHNSCTFCGEYEYFSLEARGCRNYQVLGQDLNTICQGRRYVDHRNKVFEQLSSCWPTNPVLALLVSGQTTTTPSRQG